MACKYKEERGCDLGGVLGVSVLGVSVLGGVSGGVLGVSVLGGSDGIFT